MKWILIRHGQTQGNRAHRYIGCRTDEPLCPEGIAQLQNRHYPPVSRVFVSPMRRCVETANLLYPGVPQTIIDGFRENGRADYQAWIDSGGELPFPHGESRAQFAARCVTAFEQIRQQDEDCAVVAHGGTLMAIMEKFAVPEGGYFDFQVGNGEGFVMEEDGRYTRIAIK